MSGGDQEDWLSTGAVAPLEAELAMVRASADLARVMAEDREARLLVVVADLQAELAAVCQLPHARRRPAAEMTATRCRREAADRRIARVLPLVEGQRRLVASLNAAGRESRLAMVLLHELERSLELMRTCRRLLG